MSVETKGEGNKENFKGVNEAYLYHLLYLLKRKMDIFEGVHLLHFLRDKIILKNMYLCGS